MATSVKDTMLCALHFSSWPHVNVVLAQTEGISEVPWLLARVLQVVRKLCTRRTNVSKLSKYGRLTVLLDLAQFGSRVKQGKKVLGPQSQLQPWGGAMKPCKVINHATDATDATLLLQLC